MTEVPILAQAICNRHLELADSRLRERIVGFYLFGSIALGDFDSRSSDIDFVAVTRQPLGAEDRGFLEAIHRQIREEYASPSLDGVYVTEEALQSDPRKLTDVPFHLAGEFGHAGGYDANLAVWHTLKHFPVALRGPEEPEVWTSQTALKEWSRENLNGYWRGAYERHRTEAVPLLVNRAVAWCVPGIVRVDHTIRTGEVISKAGACEAALGCYHERHHGILREALRLRTGVGRSATNPFQRRLQALALMEAILRGAQNRS